MIELLNINKSYGRLKVLSDINLSIRDNEFLSIVGPSGAGKTTLLQIIGTLDKPDSGAVSIQGQDILAFSDRKLSQFRNQDIGFVFQFHHLLPEFTAIENVLIPTMIAAVKPSVAHAKAVEMLTFLGLSERLYHKPHQLSGGEQQRVAVARALINDPKLILADEPSGNLDSQNANELHQLLFQLHKEFNKTIIVVTHNEQLASLADRKITMRDGQIL
ncbi:lipoprotein-releasing system ATP-binding protein LolD [Bacteroidia bacterium]|nr:lipoprotein-releasing system ATP-binding protein LolD [Bacteroidia bacterium]